MDSQRRTWQQMLADVAHDVRALPDDVHAMLATVSDPAVRRTWASRRDLPTALLHQRAEQEDDPYTLVRLIGQPDLTRDVARQASERCGDRHATLAYALRLDCPDRDGAERVATAAAGAAGLRAVEALLPRFGPLPAGRRRTRGALLDLLGTCSTGRDLVVLPQADSNAEHARSAEAAGRSFTSERAPLRHLVAAELPGAARVIEQMSFPAGGTAFLRRAQLESWAALIDRREPVTRDNVDAARKLTPNARSKPLRERLAKGPWNVSSLLLVNPLVHGAERRRLIGTLGGSQLASAIDNVRILRGADDLAQLRAEARRNGKAARQLVDHARVDALPARAVLGADFARRNTWALYDQVSVACRLAALPPVSRETVLSMLDEWDGTVGELVEIADLLAA